MTTTEINPTSDALHATCVTAVVSAAFDSIERRAAQRREQELRTVEANARTLTAGGMPAEEALTKAIADAAELRALEPRPCAETQLLNAVTGVLAELYGGPACDLIRMAFAATPEAVADAAALPWTELQALTAWDDPESAQVIATIRARAEAAFPPAPAAQMEPMG
jgi:hypothetical protein